ncbi:hypothetical protein ACFFYR_11920 [Paraburkholderia dipogonis]|uniref:hypothetical protein n=1 Tax=Paraburkholderia dipogonis TaxID=1211383 RepID=UPI0035EF85A7
MLWAIGASASRFSASKSEPYGCLLEELLERCDWPEASANIRALLVELKDNCLSEAIGSRPLFDEIVAAFAGADGLSMNGGPRHGRLSFDCNTANRQRAPEGEIR